MVKNKTRDSAPISFVAGIQTTMSVHLIQFFSSNLYLPVDDLDDADSVFWPHLLTRSRGHRYYLCTLFVLYIAPAPSVFPGGVGGYSGFQVTGMIKWGQKSKQNKKSLALPLDHQKNPMHNLRVLIFPERIVL